MVSKTKLVSEALRLKLKHFGAVWFYGELRDTIPHLAADILLPDQLTKSKDLELKWR